MSNILSVPNFKKWQHYKDRCPPWIKLHRDILNDYKYSYLNDASKLHLIMIWLLASQMDNKIPHDAKWIASRINATTKVDIKLLIDHGFLVSASTTLATCKDSAIAETETETETETEIRFHPDSIKPDWFSVNDWKDSMLHRKKKGAAQTERALNSFVAQIKIAKDNGHRVSACVDEMTNRGWTGFKSEWMPEIKNGADSQQDKIRSLRNA